MFLPQWSAPLHSGVLCVRAPDPLKTSLHTRCNTFTFTRKVIRNRALKSHRIVPYSNVLDWAEEKLKVNVVHYVKAMQR